MKKNDEQAFKSIERQWNGGEHKLAGARASELVYGASKNPDEKLLAELTESIPGIERYIIAPATGSIIETVPEQSGDPMARQPENRAEAIGASNLSSDAAKDEQKAVDRKLKPGREARAKAANEQGRDTPSEVVSTKLNPDPQNPTAA